MKHKKLPLAFLLVLFTSGLQSLFAQTGFRCDHRLKTFEYGRSHFGFFSADSKFVFGGGDGGWLYKWSPIKEAFLQKGEIEAGGTLISGAATRDGKYILVGSRKGTTYILDPATMSLVKSFTGRNPIKAIAITPDSKWAHDGSNVIDFENLTAKASAGSASEGRQPLSPDGKRIHDVRFNGLSIWNSANLKDTKYVEFTQNLRDVALSPDGKYLVTGMQEITGGEYLVKVIDTATWASKDYQKKEASSDYATIADFLPDGKSILFHNWGTGMIRKLDVQTGTISDLRSGEQNIVLAPDGRSFLNYEYYPSSVYVCKF